MEKTIISTNSAPKAIGPYSQGIKVNNFIYTSGQVPLDPETGDIIRNDIKSATHRSMQNVKAILEAAGSDLTKVVKITIFLKNMDDFAAVNEVYGTYFTENQPARSCVEVARLPKDAEIEIEAIAVY